MAVIALDLGGTRVKAGLVEGGTLLSATNVAVPSSDSFTALMPLLEEVIDGLLADAGRPAVKGLGISFPTIVDSDHMRLLYQYVKYADANNLDLAGWVRRNWGVPLFMENDARAALVGEWRYGAGQGTQNLLMVTIGTGVGSAVLMDGRLLKGSRYMAGNLGGHQVVRFDGRPCNCGNTGCLESEASSWSLPQLVRRTEGFDGSPFADGVPPDFEHLFAWAAQGDPFACTVRRHCLEAWAAGISNFIYAFDPEMVVLGGGVMKSADVIMPFIRRHIDRLAWLPEKAVTLAAASQPDWAGVLGMGYLAGDR